MQKKVQITRMARMIACLLTVSKSHSNVTLLEGLSGNFLGAPRLLSWFLVSSLFVLMCPVRAAAIPFTIQTPLYGAKVWVDGVLRGHSPLEELELEPGFHVLELRWTNGQLKRLFWVSSLNPRVEVIPLNEAQEARAADPARVDSEEATPKPSELTELMLGAELSVNERGGLGSTQSWSVKHPLIAERLTLRLEGVNQRVLKWDEPQPLGEPALPGGVTRAERQQLYARRFTLVFKGESLRAELGRAPLGILSRLRPPAPIMSAPARLSLGEGSGQHPLLYADRAALVHAWGGWALSLEAGRITEWSATPLRGEGSSLPYASTLGLSWEAPSWLEARAGLYGLSRLSEGQGQAEPYALDRWGASLNLDVKGPPESINRLELGVASSERSLLAFLSSGAGELLGVMVRGEAELLRAHPLHRARAPWALWPDAFDGDRARVSLSTEHIRWVEVSLQGQAGGVPVWVGDRLSARSGEYSGLYLTRYMSYPLSFFGPAYMKVSGTNRWRISLRGGELESALTTSLWAGSPGAIEVTDPLSVSLGVSWRSMELGLMSAQLDRGPLGTWGLTLVARVVFDVIGLGFRCERPTALGMIPVKGLVSCGVDVSLLTDVQFTNPE